jgi:cellulose synthase/poly-beta-1,6-N-acetylglucosamine synthase-like glycosyltransferase
MSISLLLIFVLAALNLLLVPYFVLLFATALAAVLSRTSSSLAASPRLRFLVSIPAHNEEIGIAATVQSCLTLDYPPELFQVVVIADNCTDETAEISRREGALVLERHDATRKSKGYAISFLIDHLHESGQFETLDALVVIDADSTASTGLLRGFAGLLESGHDWVQCFYTVSNPDESWRTRLMTYAFCLFNGITPLGQFKLGLSAGFRGNGMCFSTKGMRRVPWKCHGLVEDMEYSWTVRLAGEKIAFTPDVQVKGVMLGRGGKAAASQRRRWEFGRDDLKKRVFGPIMRSRHLNLIEKTTSLLELTMPSMVSLMAIYVCLLFANGWALVSFWPALTTWVSILLLTSTCLMTPALVLHAYAPFVVFRLSWSYLLVLIYLPIYAVWKFYIKLGGRPDQWVRTTREQPPTKKIGTAP